MTETPKCPYCGAETRLNENNKGIYWYECRECNATGPTEKTPVEAFYAALHRAEPEMRPLTLEEAQQISSEDGGTWLEEKTAWGLAHITPIDNQTGACYIYTFFAKFPLMAEKYGKTWRCWPRKPTPEQMAAEKWEE